MKAFLVMLLLAVVMFNVCTPAQARSNYTASWTASVDAVKYLVFYEERTTNTGFTLVDNMDYLDPTNMSALKIGEPTTLSFVTKQFNDSKYVVIGVVAVDVSGYYSLMSVSAITQKGKTPGKPGNVTFIKN